MKRLKMKSKAKTQWLSQTLLQAAKAVFPSERQDQKQS